MTQTELDDILRKSEKTALKKAEKAVKARIEELETAVEKKNKNIKKLEDTHKEYVEDATASAKRLETKLEVLEEERDEVRDVVKQQLDNDDMKIVLEQRKEALDLREAQLTDRESKIGSKEEGEYKHGYADGVADGVRKISDITQKDRDNAMKVAMVSASSHTPVANLKEINNAHQITAGTEDK